ncbi:hypothetical protein ACJMK2_018114 [Sinanodonta woodiana]|uniref:Uncharacterized protein n=1 Tax=Sinanodonta woodiana TaxID=1069815 RepID=A0ABD3UCI3_SINWO
MSRQFPNHYFSISEQISHILDSVGYSQDDRNRKYIFGSRGEGSTGPGLQSDIDYLCQHNTIKVVSDLSQCDPIVTNYLMVKDNHTHPGYVKSQMVIISSDYIPVTLYLDIGNNNITAIDSLHRTLLTNTMLHGQGTVSGPALHDANYITALSFDTVYALRCSQWPQEGN